MSVATFWVRLELRVCQELEAMRERQLQYLWCDGFVPQEYRLGGRSPEIVGSVWICNGANQAEWSFTLRLPPGWQTRTEIDWESLLPPANVTRWLSLDPVNRHLEMEPAVALPD
jgi:hypothetical protein